MITLAQVQELLNRQNAAIEKIKQAQTGNGLSSADESAIFEQLSNTTTQLEDFANTTPVTPNPNNPFPQENPPVIPSPENPVNPDNL